MKASQNIDLYKPHESFGGKCWSNIILKKTGILFQNLEKQYYKHQCRFEKTKQNSVRKYERVQ